MSPAGSVNASLICRSGLPDGGLVEHQVLIGGERESIIVHRDGNAVRAWLNVCPHQGRRLDYVPGKFLLDRGRLVCAAHGASLATHQHDLDNSICERHLVFTDCH